MTSFFAHVIRAYFILSRSRKRFEIDSLRIMNGTFEHKEEDPIEEYVTSSFKLELYKERRVYLINDKGGDSQVTLFYYHGGGYLNPIRKHHWRFLDKIAKQMDARIIVPIYNRVPESCYKIEFPLMEEIYLKYQSKNNKNSFGGDSAGGGMAIGLCYWLKEKEIKLPDALFLFSPWVDVEMKNPEIQEVKKKATMLGFTGLTIIGDIWTDNNMKDKYCSPINGELEILPPVYLYTGTYDILYPDMKIFKQRLEEKGKQITFRVYPKMEHVFIVYPHLKEGRIALEDLKKDWEKSTSC